MGRASLAFTSTPLAVQKLLEVISPTQIDPTLATIAEQLAKRLGKTVVYANDIAGFIGNGHFIRESMFACAKVHELAKDRTLPEAVYTVNKVTQEFLVRPMGLFQLMDYVGLDVCRHIGQIMGSYLPGEALQDSLIDHMVAAGILGGLTPQWRSQKWVLGVSTWQNRRDLLPTRKKVSTH